MAIDYRLFAVLCVDDDPGVLTTYRYALGGAYSVLTAGSGTEALDILSAHDVAVLLADQRMPGMTGVDLCVQARRLRPEAVRVLVTAYADIGEAVDAINRAQVARYVLKPWDDRELTQVVGTGIELVHAQRNLRAVEMKLLGDAPSQIAAAVSEEILHEVKNPLKAMTLHAQECLRFLQRTLGAIPASTGGDVRALLEGAIAAHRDTATAIEHLAALCARLGGSLGADASTESATCDLADVVRATVGLLRPQIEPLATVEVAVETSPRVRVPASMLGQVALNLLLNAAHVLRGDGHPARSIAVRIAVEGGEALLVVADGGPGIPRDQLERIFEPGFTTRRGGAGLGLSIVRDLVRRAGGTISVASEPGRGTSFGVRLPLERIG